MIPVERVYWCIGVTQGVDPRNRDVLAMTLLLRRLDPSTTVCADEWDELAEVGARIVATVAQEADQLATEPLVLSLALHEARGWLRTRSGDRAEPARRPQRASWAHVRSAIREA